MKQSAFLFGAWVCSFLFFHVVLGDLLLLPTHQALGMSVLWMICAFWGVVQRDKKKEEKMKIMIIFEPLGITPLLFGFIFFLNDIFLFIFFLCLWMLIFLSNIKEFAKLTGERATSVFGRVFLLPMTYSSFVFGFVYGVFLYTPWMFVLMIVFVLSITLLIGYKPKEVAYYS